MLDLAYVKRLKKRLDAGELPAALEARVLGFLVDLPSKSAEASALPAWLTSGEPGE